MPGWILWYAAVDHQHDAKTVVVAGATADHVQVALFKNAQGEQTAGKQDDLEWKDGYFSWRHDGLTRYRNDAGLNQTPRCS